MNVLNIVYTRLLYPCITHCRGDVYDIILPCLMGHFAFKICDVINVTPLYWRKHFTSKGTLSSKPRNKLHSTICGSFFNFLIIKENLDGALPDVNNIHINNVTTNSNGRILNTTGSRFGHI
jgi:hypothetical protein